MHTNYTIYNTITKVDQSEKSRVVDFEEESRLVDFCKTRV